ncbi:MAG: T9SS type A sorting domain-containing protein [Bacteroidetes bacterium]|nr:T9SS type A sorting domain-containing protein [Bacteroidota bacterium]
MNLPTLFHLLHVDTTEKQHKYYPMQLIKTIFVLTGLMFCTSAYTQQLNIEEPVRYLALGDSYTIGEAVGLDQRWPVQFSDSLEARGYEVEVTNIVATTGWTTGNLINSIISQDLGEEEYNLVSLLIGVNNQYQGQDIQLYEPQFMQLLDSCLAYVGGDPNRVFIVSIPDYAYTPFGQNAPDPTTISAELDEYNLISQNIAATYGVSYFNITPISREGLNDPALVAKDGLHPSGYQYTRWVEHILKQLDQQTSSTKGSPASGEVEMKIFPNPAFEEIRITVPGEIEVTGYQIYNSSGLMVEHIDTSLLIDQQIGIEHLPEGIYFLEALNDKTSVAFDTFVVEK